MSFESSMAMALEALGDLELSREMAYTVRAAWSEGCSIQTAADMLLLRPALVARAFALLTSDHRKRYAGEYCGRCNHMKGEHHFGGAPKPMDCAVDGCSCLEFTTEPVVLVADPPANVCPGCAAHPRALDLQSGLCSSCERERRERNGLPPRN